MSRALPALGSGFRCGFLGPLVYFSECSILMCSDNVYSSLVDEYEISAIITQPSITYYAKNLHKEERFRIDNPLDIERPELIKEWFEPICTASIISPADAEYVVRRCRVCQKHKEPV